MLWNYWLEQHDKEVHAIKIKEYLDDIYGGVYDPSVSSQSITSDVMDYLRRHNRTHYKVQVKLNLQTHKLTIEIP